MWAEADTAREAAHSLIDTSMNVCLPRYKLLQMQISGQPFRCMMGLPLCLCSLNATTTTIVQDRVVF